MPCPVWQIANQQIIGRQVSCCRTAESRGRGQCCQCSAPALLCKDLTRRYDPSLQRASQVSAENRRHTGRAV